MAAVAGDVRRFFEAIPTGELLQPASVQKMTTTSRARRPQDRYLENFGSGLFQYDMFQGAYGHMGLFIGTTTIAIFDPWQRYTLVLLANVSRIKNRDALVNSLLNVIRALDR